MESALNYVSLVNNIENSGMLKVLLRVYLRRKVVKSFGLFIVGVLVIREIASVEIENFPQA